jgi:DNA-3-methyladenine glycosylase
MAKLGKSNILTKRFYSRDPVEVAPDMLGTSLVRVIGRQVLIGRIVEVEAYRGADDPASHAFRGITRRTAPMFGDPGHAYVYFTYGNHYCLNVTTHPTGVPGAVLIRAIEPLQGIRLMTKFRPGVSGVNLTNGPGKLTKALQINMSFNELDLTKHGSLFVTASTTPVTVTCSTRVGINHAQMRLWRFHVEGNPYVSKPNSQGR